MVAVGVLGWASTAGAASTIEVVTVVPGPDTATVVLGVRPPPSLTRPGVFRVEDADGGAVGVDTRAVLTPQLATGVVLDTSTAGADALQGGVNGVTNFLLQLPDGVSSTVVGDGGTRPTVLAPLAQGATGAIGGLDAARAGGDRHPGDALAAALAALPTRTGTPRLLLLYTGAADAGGEPAAALSRTLQAAGVLLAVVATGDDQRYWTEVAGATGGVLVSARGSATLAAFTKVAQLLRERFVLTVGRPATLPATLLVSVRIGTGSTSESVVVPADTAGPAPPGPAGSGGGSGSAVPWWVLGVLLVVAVAAGAVLLARRWARSPEPARPLVLVGTGPSRDRSDPASPDAAPGDLRAPGGPTAAGGPDASGRPRSRPGPGSPGGSRSAGGPARTPPAAELLSAPRAGSRRPGLGARASRVVGHPPNAQPANGRPTNGQPANGQPANGQPTNGRPANGQPANGQPANGQPANGQPANGRPVPPLPAPRPATGAEPAQVSTTPLPRREPGAAAALRNRPPTAPAPDRAPTPADRRAPYELPDDRTARRAPAQRPDRRAPTPAATHPAADERAYGRLDDETGRVASLVAEGKLDRGHAVARIAMSAPGRIDLLDRVVDVERRLSGAQLGGSTPSEVVLALLAAARRVVIGEVALVGPDGARVEQAPAAGPDGAPVLTLTRHGRSREFRGTKELGRHVDLHALTAESS